MCLNRSTDDFLHAARVDRQRGFSVVSAIFILVVLTAMGAAMLTFSNVQQTTATQDLQGSRAYQAARAGMEWGIYKVLRDPPPPAAAPACFANGTSVSLAGTLVGFVVSVNCSASAYSEGTNTLTVYTITSTATQGTAGKPTRIERELQATVGR